ncbi:hypothetical protein TNCV_1604311 [Trichonephila clavipes]|nr:hypothetical protein TNCV_1604311 [Trichonephila clavipes]
MREKGGNRLVTGSDYMLGALKLPNQANRVFDESPETRVVWRYPDETQLLFLRPISTISGQSLAVNGPAVDSRYLNLVFGHTDATYNK